MPVITKETRWSPLKAEYKRTVKILKDGIFRTSLPDDVAGFVGKDEAEGQTLKEAEVAEHECFMLFREAASSSTKWMMLHKTDAKALEDAHEMCRKAIAKATGEQQ